MSEDITIKDSTGTIIGEIWDWTGHTNPPAEFDATAPYSVFAHDWVTVGNSDYTPILVGWYDTVEGAENEIQRRYNLGHRIVTR